MSFRRCARWTSALAMIACAATIVNGAAVDAQGAVTVPPVPTAPSAATGNTPVLAPNQAAHNNTPAKPSSSSELHNLLSTRMDLGDGHRVWHPTRKQLGLNASIDPSTGQPKFTVDTAAASAYLTRIAPYVRRVPAKAHIIFSPYYPIDELGSTSSGVPVHAKIAPALDGATLDIKGSVAAIQAAIAANPDATHIVLAVNTTAPPAKEPDLTGINARIAHFVTHFNPGERGRTQTVRLAISMIDGHIVQPGETFSVNQTVGERTAQRGFGTGIVFIQDHLETQLGGGMCQVATTLFNAALLANLKIVQRFQHVRTIPYVKPGQDATVYWGQKDFQFQNNTSTPIYISYKTTATHAVCDLYGAANPSVKVNIVDHYDRLGARDYTALLQRYVTENGKTSVNYRASSHYKWTPKLDYKM